VLHADVVPHFVFEVLMMNMMLKVLRKAARISQRGF